ncbi:MAG: ABC transporter permease [Gammaproteobacteria bacterium]|nr:ABC transporter permease [Gammaproteobacteria bacterium]MXW45061.1 FtsX-like permease family protein [Gammaproteobacteria bacterium]MYD01633.1 FtsX-like permease family protein [Gammaproteobacteria bacterium]MYI25154.1 FtsX-like permease family protein [Gammaproteobacteria bacterium]
MSAVDLLRLALRALSMHRLRTLLTALGTGIGVAAVILLTSIGEGMYEFMETEATRFGTHFLVITPGKTVTIGGPPGLNTNTVRPLTLDDALAIGQLSSVKAVAPAVMGFAEAEREGIKRDVTVLGTGPDLPEIFTLEVASGRFLPKEDFEASRPLAVLGSEMKNELFGADNALGAHIRVAGQRFRVVGVLADAGTMVGFDMNDIIFVPVRHTMEIYNMLGVQEVDVRYDENRSASEVEGDISRLLIARHGSEDFTITTQDQMLSTMRVILSTITSAVAALGGISLVVGGVGIFTIMTISVQERIFEIGLFRSLGARRREVRRLFMAEALALGAAGGLLGLVLGQGAAWLLSALFPVIPVSISVAYTIAALMIAVLIGILAGVAPAVRAARMNPVLALRAE